jgi:hypothetical protein
MNSNQAIELREEGNNYYAMPVIGGGVATFELISVWPNDEAAQHEIKRLEAADKHRQELAAQAREALEEWSEAADGPSGDDEHAAAAEVAGWLEVLLDELEKSSLI